MKAMIRLQVVKRTPFRKVRRQISRLGRVSLAYNSYTQHIPGAGVGMLVTLALIVGLNKLTDTRKGP